MSHQMNHPPVVELENIAGCRYMLVTAVAKRARQLLVSKEESSDKSLLQRLLTNCTTASSASGILPNTIRLPKNNP